MRKLVIGLCLLPLAACAANTQDVKTAQECRIVANDEIGSNIKTRKICSDSSEGTSAETTSPSGTLPAPH